MGTLLFKLNGVLDDEAEDIRERLSAQNISFYETSAGNWGVSLAAIWLNDPLQLTAAREIVDHYQVERLALAREEFRERQERGEIDTFWRRIRQAPVKTVLYLWVVAVILYFPVTILLNAWSE